MKYPQKAFSRKERKEQIFRQFIIWHEKGDTEPKTMTRIARALGMTPSPHVRDILLELVDEGKLAVQVREKSGRWTARGFTLLDMSFLITEKSLRRHITIKNRGRIAGQLEMFTS